MANIDYIFKEGDEVITSDGIRGTIDHICTCEYCQRRGFCEPHVVYEEGCTDDYITVYEKENGFRGYYKIGKYTFGNIDCDKVYEQIKKAEYDLKLLKKQQNRLKLAIIQKEMMAIKEKNDD